jgi:hypothetical protein
VSVFPADKIIRETIQPLLDRYLPAIQTGPEREFWEKALRIWNTTNESITVWVQRRSEVTSGSSKTWTWLPGEPSSGKAERFVLTPSESRLLTGRSGLKVPLLKGESGVPLSASRVRIWAEDESGGNRWMEYKNQDLWLVNQNPQAHNERQYRAKEIEIVNYRFRAAPGPKLFTEKLLTLRNNTHEKLSVDLRYYSNQNGKEEWRTLEKLAIEPGARMEPRDSDGMRVRASQLCFAAEGKDLYFGAHRKQPLWLVAESSNHQRTYRAEKMAEFVQEFSFDSRPNDSGQAGSSGNHPNGTRK